MRFVAAFAALWICCATLSLASVIPSYCGDDADYVYDNGRCFTLLGTQVRGVLQARARALIPAHVALVALGWRTMPGSGNGADSKLANSPGRRARGERERRGGSAVPAAVGHVHAQRQ